MLHRITGRAQKCGPSAISAIADVPTHEAAAVKPVRWSRADPDHCRIALRRVREPVRFVRIAPGHSIRSPRSEGS